MMVIKPGPFQHLQNEPLLVHIFRSGFWVQNKEPKKITEPGPARGRDSVNGARLLGRFFPETKCQRRLLSFRFRIFGARIPGCTSGPAFRRSKTNRGEAKSSCIDLQKIKNGCFLGLLEESGNDDHHAGYFLLTRTCTDETRRREILHVRSGARTL